MKHTYPKLQSLAAALLIVGIGNVHAQIPDDVRAPVEAMAAKLTGADKLELTANRTVGPILAEATNSPEQVAVKVQVERPSKLRAESSTDDWKGRHFVFDGATATLYDAGENVYATEALEGDIAAMLETLDEKFGFTPPVGKLFVPNLAESLLSTEGLQGEVVATEDDTIHLKFSGKEFDWEIWINDDLPTKFSVCLAGEKDPVITVADMQWNLSPKFADDAFTFTAPEGAEEIDMLTEEEAKKAVTE